MIVGEKSQFAIDYEFTEGERYGKITLWIGGIALAGDDLDYVSYFSEKWWVVLEPHEFLNFQYADLSPLEIINRVLYLLSEKSNTSQDYLVKCSGGFDKCFLVCFIEGGKVYFVWTKDSNLDELNESRVFMASLRFADYRNTLLGFGQQLPFVKFPTPI
ncbi:MAG: hypothetical protein AAGF87_01700 [Bacteroidota bacterium]